MLKGDSKERIIRKLHYIKFTVQNIWTFQLFRQSSKSFKRWTRKRKHFSDRFCGLATSERELIICLILQNILSIRRWILGSCANSGGCVKQITNLGSTSKHHPSNSAGSCVFVLHATVSCCHTFVSGAKCVWNTKPIREAVGCCCFDQSSFLSCLLL